MPQCNQDGLSPAAFWAFQIRPPSLCRPACERRELTNSGSVNQWGCFRTGIHPFVVIEPGRVQSQGLWKMKSQVCFGTQKAERHVDESSPEKLVQVCAVKIFCIDFNKCWHLHTCIFSFPFPLNFGKHSPARVPDAVLNTRDTAQSKTLEKQSRPAS